MSDGVDTNVFYVVDWGLVPVREPVAIDDSAQPLGTQLLQFFD